MTVDSRTRPVAGAVETRSAPDAPAPVIDGPRLRGVVPYSTPSRDLGGWTEVIEPGALNGARLDDLVANVDHAGIPIGRHPGTLHLDERADGLHWSLELPESRSDVREAVQRGDLRGSSWRMVVRRDEWRGNVRHIHRIAELRDVSVVTNPAYAEAPAEYRSASSDPAPAPAAPPEAPEEPVVDTDDTTQDAPAAVEDRSTAPSPGLTVEQRAATTQDGRTVEQRVVAAFRSVSKGESRSLTVGGAEPIEPPELSRLVLDKLRPASIALQMGMTVYPTDRRQVVLPQITSDVDPTWVAAGEVIPEGAPGITAIEAEPRKLAHRVEVENEVVDDSEPAVQGILDGHLATMLSLKLDRSIFEGNPATDPDSIRGIKYLAGAQQMTLGANGATLASYAAFQVAVAKLRRANVPGPYAIACHPDVLLGLELLTRSDGEQLPAPAGLPPFFLSSQLSNSEQAGTSNDTMSAYVLAPAQFMIVDRLRTEILLDRSRLFHMDMSELRAKLRVDLLAPNPVAAVRIRGIKPTSEAVN